MKGYTMWSQPYEHREYFVQSRSRRPLHGASPHTYAGLVEVARRASVGGLVLLAAADFDYRLRILNWVRRQREELSPRQLVLFLLINTPAHAAVSFRSCP